MKRGGSGGLFKNGYLKPAEMKDRWEIFKGEAKILWTE